MMEVRAATTESSGERGRGERRGWRRFDVAAILLLVAFSLALRLPTLDTPALNPDESQYESTASYLADTGTSPFALVYHIAGTFALFTLVAQWFGPYAIWPVRTLVLLIDVGVAVLLYRMVGRETNRWCGLLAGTVFVHYNRFHEGLTANREWFAFFNDTATTEIYTWSVNRDGRRRVILLFVAGLLSAMALWFKLQAGYILLTVPALLVWDGLRRGGGGRALRGIVAYGIGGVTSTALYLGAYAAADNLGPFLTTTVADWRTYVVENRPLPAAERPGTLLLYARQFLADRPGIGFLLAAYATCLLAVAGAFLGRIGRPFPDRWGIGGPVQRAFVLYLVTAMMAVQMGQRFFAHYFIFFAPAVAALVAFAAYQSKLLDDGNRWIRTGGAVLLAAALGTRLWGTVSESPRTRFELWPLAGLSPVLAIAIATLLVYWLWRPRRHLRRTLIAYLCLEVALLTLTAQVRPRPSALPYHAQRYDQLVTFLRSQAEEGDRLFVWGWAPEIYTLSRLEAASQFTICMYLVGDYSRMANPRLDTDMETLLLSDLRQRRPKFFVDASRRSWTMEETGQPWIYDLRLYRDSALTDYLTTEYTPAAMLDNCVVHIRRTPNEPDRPAGGDAPP
jgi:hypothetical protein